VSAITDLPDLNIWLALSSEDHPMHRLALDYWRREAPSSLAFCRVTAIGLPRLLCQKTHPASIPFTPAEAWEMYQSWRSKEGVFLQPDPEGVEERLASFVKLGLVIPRLWTDAYLAAFAMAAGHRLVSFDRDFERFPGLNLLRI
jgi:hypothetical protein